MKVLTIQQPYASLIAEGDKWIENRTWETNFRGPILIHAGLSSRFITKDQLAKYPTGAALCIADSVECYELTTIERCARLYPRHQAGRTGKTWPQLLRHEHAEGPVCWVLVGVRKLPEPIPMTGAQGLFNVPDDVRAALKRMGVIR